MSPAFREALLNIQTSQTLKEVRLGSEQPVYWNVAKYIQVGCIYSGSLLVLYLNVYMKYFY